MMALPSLAKTLTSRSRCFYLPLKTYTHGTTSPFPTADPRVATLLEKRQANSGYFPRYVTNDGGLIFEGKCIFDNKPPPQSRSCLLLKKGGGGLFSGGYGISL